MTATVCVCGRPAVAYLHPTHNELRRLGPLLPQPVCAHHACLNTSRLATIDETTPTPHVETIDTPDRKKLLAALDRIGDNP